MLNIAHLSLLLLLPANNPNPWESVKEDGPLKVWERAVPNSDLREIKAEIVINVPSKRVWEVLNDFPNYSDFMPYVEEARILSRNGEKSLLVYQRVDPPLVSQRDYTIRLNQTVDHKNGLYVREIVGVPNEGPPPKDGVLRLTKIKGQWVLEPLGPNKMRLAYQVYSDPGSIPSWIANKASKRNVL